MTTDGAHAQRWFAANDLDGLLRPIYATLIEHGDRVEPTRGATRELRGAHLELADPRARLSRSWIRGRAFSAVAEFVWYASGTNVVAQMEAYVPRYANHIGGQDFQLGAYGPRLFGPSGQLERIIELLGEKASTRKAVIQLFDRDDLNNDPADVPCTCTLQFFVRHDLLELHVHMRSNDAYLGLTHDVFCFTMLQEYVASRLGYELGAYIHTVGSLHLYEEHLGEVATYMDEGYFAPESMPGMPWGSCEEDLTQLVNMEAAVRGGGDLAAIDEGYWGDLIRILWLQLRGGAESAEYNRVRAAMSSRYFEPYISDKQNRMLRRSGLEESV